MAAYQPIQMPNDTGGYGLADAFRQMREDKRQKMNDAWNHYIQQGVSNRADAELALRQSQDTDRHNEMVRRQQQEEQDRNEQVIEHIRKLHENGLSSEAQQLAQLYGFTGTEDQQTQGPRVGQLYNNQDLGNFAKGTLADDQVTAAGKAAGAETQRLQDERDQYAGALDENKRRMQQSAGAMASGQPGNFQPVAVPPVPSFVGPLDTPEHADAAERERLLMGSGSLTPPPDASVNPGPASPVDAATAQYTQNPIFHYKGANGVAFDVDPRERLRAALTQRKELADRFQAAFKGDPNMAPYAGEFAARAELGEEPKGIFGDLRARQLADAEARRKAAGEPAHSAGRFEQEKELARIKAAGDAARTNTTTALPTIKEIDEAIKPVTEKGGIRDQMQHMGSTLEQLHQQPNNPVAWTNAIDAAIRTNTGRAAIKAQYDLYRAHAGGTVQKFEDWLEGAKSGNLGETSRQNFLNAFQGSYHELQQEEKRYADTINLYEQDPRLANPVVKQAFEGHRRNAFGPTQNPLRQHGPSAKAAQGETRVVDGVTWRKVGKNHWEPAQ